MPSVKKFLLERIKNAGIETVFGVPGDYMLGTYKAMEDDPDITLIGATDESHAGFAADAYARVHGLGCVFVTYNVGALKCLNPLAGAYAEHSPVILLTGSPGIKERKDPLLLHHTVGDYDTQWKLCSKVTCAQTVLSDPATAAYEIDRVIEAMKHHRQPVYIELPRDVADKPISYDIDQGTPKTPTSDTVNLEDAVHEVSQWIMAARDPVIVAGVELSRFGFGDELVKFAERTNIPMFTEALSKSTVGERHPLFGGVYCGVASPEPVRKMVDNSDCILMLGVMLTDLMIGSAKPAFASRQTVRANIGTSLKVRNHTYEDIVFQEFCSALFAKGRDIAKKPAPAIFKKTRKKFVAGDGPITTSRFFEKVDSIIDKNSAIVTDVGDVLFGALDLTVDHANSFISPAYYTSMGNAIPAALGVCMAKPGMRPIVLVGDGAFQMSLSEISNFVRYRLNPIIFVLNNQGYTTERFILEGKFNDIANWNYHNVDALFGGGRGYLVRTEAELEHAVTNAIKSDEVSVINVVVGPKDVSAALERVTESLTKRMH